MARYIDTSKVTIPKGFFEDLNVPKLLNWLNNQPTADVVPKSEVERWKEINEQLHKEMSERILEERKIARKLVARGIFAEIEKLHLHVTNEFDLRRYEELKKKYTEEKT